VRGSEEKVEKAEEPQEVTQKSSFASVEVATPTVLETFGSETRQNFGGVAGRIVSSVSF